MYRMKTKSQRANLPVVLVEIPLAVVIAVGKSSTKKENLSRYTVIAGLAL